MASNVAETVIGAVVLAIAGGFIWYASQVSEMTGGGEYPITATFRKAEGVSSGGDVRIAGVKVGTIRSMELDTETYQARVEMVIDDEVQVPEDSSASIASEGLLGGSYIAIAPGGSEFMLEPGGVITRTQSSVSLLDLVGRAITGGGSE